MSMSELRSPDQIIDVRIDQGPTDVHCYPPQPAQDQTSQRLSHSSDSSIPLFTLHLRIAEEHNRRTYELLKGHLDSIIVFCGLFSAAVAALIVPSIGGNNSQDSSTAQALPNNTQADNSQTTSFAVFEIVNLLWIYSLIFSIYCALHSLVLQQLTKPRTVTSPHYGLPEQARMGAYFIRRIERAEETVEKLQFMMVLSLIIFFLGLGVYLFSFDYGIAVTAVVFISIYPIYLFYRFLRHRRKTKLSRAGSPHYTPSTQEKIQGQGSRSDSDVLRRTLDMMRSDDDLEQFFEAIPGFCASKIVDNPRLSLDVLGLPRLAEALIEFWNRTLSSNRVEESVKVRRLAVCVKVIGAADLSIAVPHILRLFSGDLGEVTRSVETGHSLRSLCNGDASSLARGIIASVISDAERNDRWFVLAMDELGIPRDILQDYLACGDSVLLANLIHISRHFLHGLLQPHPDLTRQALTILPSVSKFDILNTLPELQHDFCALWNDVVRQEQSSSTEDNPFKAILFDIWDLYVTLHGTTATKLDPLHPPLCEDDGHRNLTTQVGGDTSSESTLHPELPV